MNIATPLGLKPMIKTDNWTTDIETAVKDADVIYTDTWVSMGEEKNKEELINLLKPYQVNKNIIKEKYFMHCLPAIKGQEVTEEVIYSMKSLVFQQAENRMHIQKAIILKLMGAV